MYIVSRDKETILNTEQVTSIYIEDCAILVNAGHDHFMFTAYNNAREAKHDFQKIMMELKCNSVKYLELGGNNDDI